MLGLKIFWGDDQMPRDEIVLYEVFNFKGSNFYCPDCFNKHPDSKDWIKKVYTQKKPFEKGNVVCCKCKKELVAGGRSGEEVFFSLTNVSKTCYP